MKAAKFGVTLAASAALAVGGCASAIDGPPSGPPRHDRPPAGQIVFQDETGGGFVPYEYTLTNRPWLTIYGNGDAYVISDPDGSAQFPVAFRRGQVSATRLDALVDEAGRSGLFDHADFGTPYVTDLGTTRMTFRPGRSPAHSAQAYALSFTEGDGDLTPRQRANRAALRALEHRLRDSVVFPDGPATEWAPARIDVTEVEDTSAHDTAVPWPGPDPSTLLTTHTSRGACGMVTGADAARLYRAAREHNDTRWTVDGTERILIVRALLPGERGCVR